jgi:hypothetical protein
MQDEALPRWACTGQASPDPCLSYGKQGRQVPLAPETQAGNRGLGFVPAQPRSRSAPATTSTDAPSAAISGQGAGAAAGARPPDRTKALVAAELAAEGLDVKIKRHKQLIECVRHAQIVLWCLAHGAVELPLPVNALVTAELAG